MKIILASMIVLLLHASTNAADKITIGISELNAQFLPLVIGKKRGFFKEDGLQAHVIRINPTVAFAALVSGELDYWTVIENSVAAAMQGVPLRVLTCYVPGSPSALITCPEFKSVPELRGKAIGLNASGSKARDQERNQGHPLHPSKSGSTIQIMMDWSKSDKEMASAGYESVVRLFNDDGSVPEKGFPPGDR